MTHVTQSVSGAMCILHTLLINRPFGRVVGLVQQRQKMLYCRRWCQAALGEAGSRHLPLAGLVHLGRLLPQRVSTGHTGRPGQLRGSRQQQDTPLAHHRRRLAGVDGLFGGRAGAESRKQRVEMQVVGALCVGGGHPSGKTCTFRLADSLPCRHCNIP